jgi:hypothetical protein
MVLTSQDSQVLCLKSSEFLTRFRKPLATAS